jgi:hypothetical protein
MVSAFPQFNFVGNTQHCQQEYVFRDLLAMAPFAAAVLNIA